MNDSSSYRKPGKPLRAQPRFDPAKFGPIRIEDTPDGRFKIAVCSAGYRANATATFNRRICDPLAAELSQARTVWQRTKQIGEPPDPQIIRKSYPTIGYLCTDDVVRRSMAGKFTPRQTAVDILQELFPQYERDSIERMTRSMKNRRGMK